MSIYDVLILIVTVVMIAAVVGAFVSREQDSLEQMTKKYYKNEQQPSSELHSKDLRPIVVNKAPKKQKVEAVPQGIVQEPVKQETQTQIAIDKPNKKRKYYPKNK